MTITKYLEALGSHLPPELIVEGGLIAEQAHYINQLLLQLPEITKICEVGFNAGHSAAAFLGARDNTQVLSFDLGEHNYVQLAKRVIDLVFPRRHVLVLGDSTFTIPLLRDFIGVPEGSVDLIYVDGGHIAPVPELDLRNLLFYLHKGGLVMLDDYCEAHGSDGVLAAWDSAVSAGKVELIDGPHQVRDRGWLLGRKL
ncbi:MAG: class I SAM-dependent methyltransferase [Bdellovibrionales bacterium]|nr:class I SAM-dependent methyltransferase [Bdellovibrionales bacterium]